MSDPTARRSPADADPAEWLTADACPALAAFVGGYLHEEFAYDHGSATGAAWAFARDAEIETIAAAAREWELLEALAARCPVPEVADLLAHRFGSAWQPLTRAELAAVGDELRRALEEPEE